jgi:hypothetical protein
MVSRFAHDVNRTFCLHFDFALERLDGRVTRAQDKKPSGRYDAVDSGTGESLQHASICPVWPNGVVERSGDYHLMFLQLGNIVPNTQCHGNTRSA